MKSAVQRRDIGIGLLAVGFAILAITVWIPIDVATPIIDTWRRTVRIGDAMLPTFAAIGIAASGAGLLVQSVFKPSETDFQAMNPVFFGGFALIFVISVCLMLFTGPVSILVWSFGDLTYRQVLNTPPWKYLGFMVGGVSLTFGLISLSYRQLHLKYLLVSAVVVTTIAILYSLPSESLLIPPNREY